ncbi:MAG: hypothetical protein K8R89_01260 [Anaerolineae bacterium]|nr:hypothetical protein [Anaerolineae bacterium]
MRKRIMSLLILICLLLAACRHSQPESGEVIANPIQFSGKVHRGKMFEKPIGAGLAFRLNYSAGDGEGWEIWVGNPTQPDHNFSAVVTPPYRGMNARYIEGWHFRNSDNSGPNDASVNAPQEVRRFEFVLDQDNYEVAHEALGCLLWVCDDLSFEQAADLHESTMKAAGILTITQMELGNLVLDELAWINQFNFKVELLYLPHQ